MAVLLVAGPSQDLMGRVLMRSMLSARDPCKELIKTLQIATRFLQTKTFDEILTRAFEPPPGAQEPQSLSLLVLVVVVACKAIGRPATRTLNFYT